MVSKQTPSSSLYVIQVTDEQRHSLQKIFDQLGSLEELPGSPDLAVIRVRDEVDGPKETWKKTQDAVGPDAAIQPVLLDVDGNPQFPTGEVTIRFKNTMSDRELEGFAASHALRLVRRNEAVPEQAVFSAERRRYLPEVIDELSRTSEAKVVWANTLARYDRS